MIDATKQFVLLAHAILPAAVRSFCTRVRRKERLKKLSAVGLIKKQLITF